MTRTAGVLVVLMLGAPLQAQRSLDSHARIPSTTQERDWNDVLARRLREITAEQTIRKLLGNKELSASQLQNLLANSPVAADIVRRIRNGDQDIIKLAEQLARNNPNLRNLDVGELAERLFPRNESPAQSTSPNNTGLIRREQDRLTEQTYAERITDFLKDLKLEGVSEGLRDSPVFRNWVQELTRSNSLWHNGPIRLNSQQIATIADWAKGIQRNLPANMPSFNRFDLRSTGLNRLGNFNLRTPSLPRSFMNASPAHGWSSAVAVLAVVAVAVAVFVIYRPSRKHKRRHRVEIDAWPLDPAGINNRVDLIRAFEYLAVARLGWPAAHWHHREVASQLSNNGDSDAASVLARCYEVARYAPAQSTAELDFSAARSAFARLSEIAK